jgi:uncharacterized membrane protein
MFFFLSCTGWLLETVQESLVRHQFINKGFFRGPYVPVHGIGGIFIYFLTFSLKSYPVLVCFVGIAIGTVVEYLTSIFLEKCFKVKCWDYTTYPHTKWCHFQGRICLTISLFFGIITLFIVYFYWDFALTVADFLGNYIWVVDGIFMTLFFTDGIFSCTSIIKAKKKNIQIKSWAVFSDSPEVP